MGFDRLGDLAGRLGLRGHLCRVVSHPGLLAVPAQGHPLSTGHYTFLLDMRVPCWSVLLLAVAAFSLSTALEPRFQEWEGDQHASDNILQAALGDGRKLFAKHFYTKAD